MVLNHNLWYWDGVGGDGDTHYVSHSMSDSVSCYLQHSSKVYERESILKPFDDGLSVSYLCVCLYAPFSSFKIYYQTVYFCLCNTHSKTGVGKGGDKVRLNSLIQAVFGLKVT